MNHGKSLFSVDSGDAFRILPSVLNSIIWNACGYSTCISDTTCPTNLKGWTELTQTQLPESIRPLNRPVSNHNDPRVLWLGLAGICISDLTFFNGIERYWKAIPWWNERKTEGIHNLGWSQGHESIQFRGSCGVIVLKPEHPIALLENK